jgi:hypothetical protein
MESPVVDMAEPRLSLAGRADQATGALEHLDRRMTTSEAGQRDLIGGGLPHPGTALAGKAEGSIEEGGFLWRRVEVDLDAGQRLDVGMKGARRFRDAGEELLKRVPIDGDADLGRAVKDGLKRMGEAQVELVVGGMLGKMVFGVPGEGDCGQHVVGAVVGELPLRDLVPLGPEAARWPCPVDAGSPPIREATKEVGSVFERSGRVVNVVSVRPPIPAVLVDKLEHQQRIVDPAGEFEADRSEKGPVGGGAVGDPPGLMGGDPRTEVRTEPADDGQLIGDAQAHEPRTSVNVCLDVDHDALGMPRVGRGRGPHPALRGRRRDGLGVVTVR